MKTKTYLSASATLLALAAFVMVGCETTDITPDPNPATLTISAEGGELTVPADGDDVRVTYEVANPVEDGTVSASSSESWATVTDDDTPGVVTVNVTANDSGAERTARITVTYTWAEGECSDKVDLVQPAAGSTSGEYDYELTATVFTGELYDDMANNGEANFYTFLSDMPFDSDGYADIAGTYYLFDIFAPASALETEALPAGTYTLGEPYATEEMTFGIDYSCVYLPGEEGRYLTDGTLVVTVEGDTYTFDAVLTDETGATHHVTYTGPTEYSYSPGGGGDEDEDGYAVVENDLDVTASLVAAVYNSKTDETMSVTMQFTDMDVDAEGYVTPPGTLLYVETYMPFNTDGSIATGTYTMSSNGEDLTFLPGVMEDYYGIMYIPSGTYAYCLDEYGSESYGVIAGGTMEISGGAGNYTVECNFVTAEGVTVTCSYSGALSVQGLPSITDDYELDLTNAVGYGYYYGDGYGTGDADWIFSIEPTSGTGDGIQAEVLAEGLDFNAGIPSGTYTAATGYYPAAGEFVTGYLSNGYLYGTCYIGLTNNSIYDYSPAVDGELEVTNNGDGTYSISLNLINDLGYRMTGEWSGTMEMIDYSSYSGYSASSVRPAAKAVAKDVQKAGIKAADVSKIQVRPADKTTASVSKVKKIRLTR